MSARLVIGSRGSELALWQANYIKDILEKKLGCQTTIQIIKTVGDKIDTLSFEKMEGKGFFTKELEDALLANEIDLAVHSLKDLMTTQPAGLKLGAVGYREDRRELLLIHPDAYTGEGVIPVARGSVIGTSAARRKAQIAFHNRSLIIEDLRGNVPTRVRKLREGQYQAILLASAGVKRLQLDLSDLKVIALDPEQFLPAPAQGILGLQIRDNDARVEAIVSQLGSIEAMREAMLERGLLAMFDSGCSLPLGVFSEIQGPTARLKAVLGVREGDQWLGLRKVDLSGDNDVDLLRQAFAKLHKDTPCVA